MAENQVSISSADRNPNFLGPKLQAGNGIALSNNGNFIRIDALGETDHKVAVDIDDNNPNYLSIKLEAGSGISLTNTGSTIKIGADVQTGDHKISVDSADSSPDYLANKITAGSNVSLTNTGSAIQVSATDTIWPDPMTTEGDIVYENSSLQPARLGIGTNGQVLTVDSGIPSWQNIPTQTGDHKVLATSADTSPNYLDQKLSGSGVVAVTDNTTSLSVGITPSITDGQVLTTDNGQVAWKTPATQTGDHKVAVNSSDSSPDYLFDKIEAGTNISTSVSSGKVKIDAATQTGDHKILASNSDTDPAGYLDSKISFSSPLIATGSNNLSVAIDYGQDGQILATEGTTVKWVNAPKRIDWSIETALLNGTFNQTVDRTFYVEVFPECSFSTVDSVVAVLRNANSGDEWRAAVYDNNRNMVYYGTSTGTNANFRKITLTKLADFDFDANNVFFLALSQHTAGSSSSQIATATVTSPFYCWYEDHVLESGRAMPANASLTAVSGKVPAIGLRGR